MASNITDLSNKLASVTLATTNRSSTSTQPRVQENSPNPDQAAGQGTDQDTDEAADQTAARYGPLHFLSIPVELRQSIWWAMLEEINRCRETPWFTKPRVEFLPLMLTCRQLYTEIQVYRPQTLIPYDGFGQFFRSFRNAAYVNKHNIAKLRSMSIQFRQEATPRAYELLTTILRTCKNTLEELHLSFVGVDNYRTKIYVHGCAYTWPLGEETKLPPDGQNIIKMLAILKAIFEMTNLRILVLSNLNYQLFRTVFKHKPKLEYLHITTDPRSAVHSLIDDKHLGILLTPFVNFFPPLKVLELSANSMLTAIQLPSTCARTLEHLTWTVPDTSLGSNRVGADLFSQTRQLMHNFALNSGRLRTLRICVQGAGLYGNAADSTELEAALTEHISSISSLRNVEIHSMPRSRFYADSLLRALPSAVERFYTRDDLIPPAVLLNFISERYLSSQSARLRAQSGSCSGGSLANGRPQQPLSQEIRENWSEYRDLDRHESSVTIWFDPTTSDSTYHAPADPTRMYRVLRKFKARESLALLFKGIVGEDKKRTDYIPMGCGNLTFVTYDFANSPHSRAIGEKITRTVLWLNGRLLDRAHNAHLSHKRAGVCIEPQSGNDWWVSDEESHLVSQHPGVQHLLSELHAVECDFPRNIGVALAELEASPLTRGEGLFGDIDAAYMVFLRECPARTEARPDHRYPYYVDNDGQCDGRCHWMCPEAVVPTLAQMDEARAKAIAEKRRIKEVEEEE